MPAKKDWRVDFRTMSSRGMGEYSRGELTVAVLAVVAGVALLPVAFAIAPGLATLVKIFKPKNKTERLRLRRVLASLEERGMLRQGKESGILFYRATAKGISLAKYDALRIKKLRWDHRWRLCMFDIPEEYRGARIQLSRKSIDMGMRHFQKSVFISPYPCEEEFRNAASFLSVESHVQVVTATHISNASRFKKEFGL